MDSVKAILNQFGAAGVQAIKNDLQKYSATGKTVSSIKYKVSSPSETTDQLVITGRPFVSALETGRGPRKSSEEGDFQDNLEDWVRVRFPELDDKKRKRFARFLRLKINRQGDKTHRQGGREVYSATVVKIAEGIKAAVQKDFRINFTRFVKNALGESNNS